jgi:L-alanine-DL-glutamate epimerase-like enolase superfamily enzyme
MKAVKSNQRIRRVSAVPVRVPRVAPLKSALGTSVAGSFGIVEVETEEGLSGLGEISMIWNGGGAALCPMVNELLGPALIGQSAFAINRAHQTMGETVQFSRAANPAKAAIDMALYDIVGKALGTPVYNLLGGRVREGVPLSLSIMIGSLDEMVAQARDAIQRGFAGVKVKVGVDPVHDIESVSAIRKALGPQAVIRVDANMGWHSTRQALSQLEALAPLNIHSVEQPLPADRIEDLAWLRQRSPMPIMVDESVWGPDDAVRVIRAGAADIINVYVSEAGGLRNAARIFALAEMNGIACTIGSMPELGIGTAAEMHLAAAMPELTGPADVSGVLYNAQTLITERLPIKNGSAGAPDRPGLGVTLDRARMLVLMDAEPPEPETRGS